MNGSTSLEGERGTTNQTFQPPSTERQKRAPNKKKPTPNKRNRGGGETTLILQLQANMRWGRVRYFPPGCYTSHGKGEKDAGRDGFSRVRFVPGQDPSVS
ncbi:hypothetical protein TESG_05294 [Trichophyton tonsurans CBS 112818]|uniref:Uncharacterized protein n=1 Tax=Trichophyton tonsurans (strain CBS 112818) TaxID=647933 RepID=F2S356_TRIT1|nr:hypothetical protein TESG_05294 [Trichophyton tonsurans CBS 112818]